MKIHEAAAVYLIIGSVMMGPIERLYTIRSAEDGLGQMKYETTAETCARAIREIGAVPFNPLRGQPNRRSYQLRHFTPSGKPWNINVLCIPAPSGLVQ